MTVTNISPHRLVELDFKLTVGKHFLLSAIDYARDYFMLHHLKYSEKTLPGPGEWHFLDWNADLGIQWYFLELWLSEQLPFWVSTPEIAVCLHRHTVEDLADTVLSIAMARAGHDENRLAEFVEQLEEKVND